jgi:hypothetical protein
VIKEPAENKLVPDALIVIELTWNDDPRFDWRQSLSFKTVPAGPVFFPRCSSVSQKAADTAGGWYGFTAAQVVFNVSTVPW